MIKYASRSRTSKIAFALVVLAFVFPRAAHSSEIIYEKTYGYGQVTARITQEHYTLTAFGQTIIEINNSGSVAQHFILEDSREWNGFDVALFAHFPGGTACPARHQILLVSQSEPYRAYLSEPFGCSDIFEIRGQKTYQVKKPDMSGNGDLVVTLKEDGIYGSQWASKVQLGSEYNFQMKAFPDKQIPYRKPSFTASEAGVLSQLSKGFKEYKTHGASISMGGFGLKMTRGAIVRGLLETGLSCRKNAANHVICGHEKYGGNVAEIQKRRIQFSCQIFPNVCHFSKNEAASLMKNEELIPEYRQHKSGSILSVGHNADDILYIHEDRSNKANPTYFELKEFSSRVIINISNASPFIYKRRTFNNFDEPDGYLYAIGCEYEAVVKNQTLDPIYISSFAIRSRYISDTARLSFWTHTAPDSNMYSDGAVNHITETFQTAKELSQEQIDNNLTRIGCGAQRGSLYLANGSSKSGLVEFPEGSPYQAIPQSKYLRLGDKFEK